MAADSVRSADMSTVPSSDRNRDLAAIRATYDRYRRENRGRLWDPSNRGFARMMLDRDLALIELIRRSLPYSGGRVLDLGSGDGRLALVARDAQLAIETWVGVDLDPAAVVSASASVPSAMFLAASADALPFEASSFDVIVASTLFSSLPSDSLERAVAAEVARVLVPGGRLVWYDLRYNNPMNRDVHAISRERLMRTFPGWKVDVRAMTLLPPMARRLGLFTSWLYRPLELLPTLRSHYVGLLRKPSGSI